MIPFNAPPVVGTELDYMQSAMNSGKLCGDGGFTRRCQQWMEQRFGTAKALLTPSCTASLEMAALLLDIINVSGWTPDQMADITGRPALLTTFTFGKYRGKAVAEIAENDPGYLRWLFNNLDRMSPELRLTLRHYLGE